MSQIHLSTPRDHLITGCQYLTGFITKAIGIIAAFSLVTLTVSIILGIGLRLCKIDNAWTYDLDMFCLIWLAFTGAVTAAVNRQHVTAGVSLENLVGKARLLIFLRFVVIFSFLAFMTVSAFSEAMGSFQMQEVTLDVVQWPVWIAKISIPIGTGAWAIAELHAFLSDISQPSN